MTNTPKYNSWISDVREGMKELNKDFFYYFNDKTDNQRRIKCYTSRDNDLTIDDLVKLQSFIEERRPYLNVTVTNWKTNSGPYSYEGPAFCVYYKPKVQFSL
jgi:hypothetical protein